jgi:uncharacterized membrane protein
MSVLSLILVILEWMVIATSVFVVGFTLTELASARTKTGKINDDMRSDAWRTILLCSSLTFGACAHFLHGTASWLLLGLSLCLVSAFLTLQVRSVRNS